MKKKRIRFISVLISVMLVMGNAGAMLMADNGDPETLTFIRRDRSIEEGQLVETDNFTKLSESIPSTWTDGLYFLDVDLTYNEPIVIDASDDAAIVALVLGDGKTLNATEGIEIRKGHFSVYTQSDDSGKLIASASENAGISFLNSQSYCNLCGGIIEATGADYCAGIGGKYQGPMGSVYVIGSQVEATGGKYAAGIGTGYQASTSGSCIVKDGTVVARGGEDGPGIGSGKGGSFDALVFEGGKTYAYGNGMAPGVGAYDSVMTFVLMYGELYAEGGESGGAGIGWAAGTGSRTVPGSFNIIQTHIEAVGGAGAAGIGGGYGVSMASPIMLQSDYNVYIKATAGQIEGRYAQAIGAGLDADNSSLSATFSESGSAIAVFGPDGKQVKKADRKDALKLSSIIVTCCEHPDLETLVDHDDPEPREDCYYHDIIKECKYCTGYYGSSIYHIEHTFDPETHQCECGHQGYKVSVIGVEDGGWEIWGHNGTYCPDMADCRLYITVDDEDREIRVEKITYVDPVDGQVKTCDYTIIDNDSMPTQDTVRFTMPSADVTVEVYVQMLVSFDCNGGSGSMEEPDPMDCGTEYTLPECEFTAPAGMLFAGWKIGDSEEILPAGEKITVDKDLTLVAQWVEANQVILKAGNVDFDGCIHLMFRMNFAPDLLDDSGLYVELTKHGETTKVYLNDTNYVSQKNGDYYISLPVPIPEFADDVTLKVIDGTGATVKLVSSSGERMENDSFTYSVMEYAENKQTSDNQNMATLAKALYWYGVAAQNYFEYDSGVALTFDDSVMPATLHERLENNYAYSKSGTRPEGIDKTTIKAYFESDNTMSITFYMNGSVPVSDYEISVVEHDDPSKVVDARLLYGSRKVSIEVENIPAPELGKAYDFTISYGGNTYTISASPMSYALTSYKSTDVNRQRLGLAFFAYHLAAKAYFSDSSTGTL